MSDGDERGEADLVDLVLLSDGEGASGLRLPFTRAVVVGVDDVAGSWRGAQHGSLYLELNSTTAAGRVTEAIDRAAQLGVEWSVVLGLGSGSLTPMVRSELDATEGWRAVGVLTAGDVVAVELAPDARSGSLGRLIDGLGGIAARHQDDTERIRALERQSGASEAESRRRRDTIEDVRHQVGELQERLSSERAARQQDRSSLHRAQAQLTAARQRIATLEGTRAMRLTRRYWTLRARAVRSMGSGRGRPGASPTD